MTVQKDQHPTQWGQKPSLRGIATRAPDACLLYVAQAKEGDMCHILKPTRMKAVPLGNYGGDLHRPPETPPTPRDCQNVHKFRFSTTRPNTNLNPAHPQSAEKDCCTPMQLGEERKKNTSSTGTLHENQLQGVRRNTSSTQSQILLMVAFAGGWAAGNTNNCIPFTTGTQKFFFQRCKS